MLASITPLGERGRRSTWSVTVTAFAAGATGAGAAAGAGGGAAGGPLLPPGRGREGARGAVIVGCFGAVRGLTPLAAAHVRTPAQLMAVHRGLARWRAPVLRGSTGALAALCLLALTQAVA